MPPALRVESLWKCYAAGVRGCSARAWVLRGLSLTIEIGERVAIVGGAGSGKTTLAECILGLRAPDVGLIELAARLDVVDERVQRAGGDAVLAFARSTAAVQPWADRVLLLSDGRLRTAPLRLARRVAESGARVLPESLSLR